MSMNEAPPMLKTAPLFRVWDGARNQFLFTDQRPNDDTKAERWTGFFDKESRPIYENDILSLHYDWKLGWVTALVEREPSGGRFTGKVITPEGTIIYVGSFNFCEAYVEGNLRQHPQKLQPATEQFSDPAEDINARLWSEVIFSAIRGTNLN